MTIEFSHKFCGCGCNTFSIATTTEVLRCTRCKARRNWDMSLAKPGKNGRNGYEQRKVDQSLIPRT